MTSLRLYQSKFFWSPPLEDAGIPFHGGKKDETLFSQPTTVDSVEKMHFISPTDDAFISFMHRLINSRKFGGQFKYLNWANRSR